MRIPITTVDGFRCDDCEKWNSRGSAGVKYGQKIYGRNCHTNGEPIKAYLVIDHSFVCRDPECGIRNPSGSTGMEYRPGWIYGKDCHDRPQSKVSYAGHRQGRVKLFG